MSCKIKGIKETSVKREIRKAKEYDEKLKAYEEKLIKDINISLIQKGYYTGYIYSDKANYLRKDLAEIGEKIAKKYKNKGYHVSDYRYADSNRSKVYSLYIAI